MRWLLYMRPKTERVFSASYETLGIVEKKAASSDSLNFQQGCNSRACVHSDVWWWQFTVIYGGGYMLPSSVTTNLPFLIYVDPCFDVWTGGVTMELWPFLPTDSHLRFHKIFTSHSYWKLKTSGYFGHPPLLTDQNVWKHVIFTAQLTHPPLCQVNRKLYTKPYKDLTRRRCTSWIQMSARHDGNIFTRAT